MSGRGTYLDCGCYIQPGGGRSWCPTCAAGEVGREARDTRSPAIGLDALRQLAELANEWKAGEGVDEIEPGYMAGRVDAAHELVEVLERISGCKLQVPGTGTAPSIMGEPR